jgi:large conductance mechanosensitive channel
MLKGFRDFISRGNVVDLAVAVVIGAAFSAIVTSLVRDLITPIIAAVGGQPDFSDLFFTINGSRFMYGSFVNAVISFVIIAAAIYFLVVVPLGKVLRRPDEPDPNADMRACPECLSLIPNEARRCMYCTAQVEPAAARAAAA